MLNWIQVSMRRSFPLLAMLLVSCAPPETTELSGTNERESSPPTTARDATVPDTPQADGLTLREGRNPAIEDRADRYWSKAYREVYRSPDELAAQDARERRNGEALPKLIRGNPNRREIALTFDDGPHPAFTARLLDLLKAEGVPATFFVVGKKAEAAPGLVRRMVAEGHEVGNHTFSHVTLTKIPVLDVAAEYRATSDLIGRLIGKRPAYCRPPGGDYDPDVIRAANAEGMTTVLWTDDPGDYANPAADVLLRRATDRLENGAIILLHDGPASTLATLPAFIAGARARGFKFVSLHDLART